MWEIFSLNSCEVWATDHEGHETFIGNGLSPRQAHQIADNVSGLHPNIRAWVE